MLSKLSLLVLLVENKKSSVKAYFVNKLENIVICQKFKVWSLDTIGRCINLKYVFEELEQKVLLIELHFNVNIATIVSTDCNSNIIKTPLDLQTAIIYAQYFDIPIFTKTLDLQKKGIKVTKQFIEDIE